MKSFISILDVALKRLTHKQELWSAEQKQIAIIAAAKSVALTRDAFAATSFGSMLKALRGDSSQQELAIKCGTFQPYISRMEADIDECNPAVLAIYAYHAEQRLLHHIDYSTEIALIQQLLASEKLKDIQVR